MGADRISHTLASAFVARLEEYGLDRVLADLVSKDTGGTRARAMIAAARSGTLFLPRSEFVVRKTVTLGLHPTIEAFRESLERGGSQVGGHASQIFAKTPLATERTAVELVLVTGRELGFTQNYTLAEVTAAGEKRGHRRSPAEVGPALREAYTDQPVGEVVRICMDPIADSDAYPHVFDVYHHDGGRWLSANYTHPAGEWGPETVWVFAASKR